MCQTPPGDNQINFGNGTAFMIAPGVCAIAAHVLHVEGKKVNALQKKKSRLSAPLMWVNLCTFIKQMLRCTANPEIAPELLPMMIFSACK
jgi:hypothetical protein